MNLAIFFDGTWNEPNDKTNAFLLFNLAKETDDQARLYVQGVGTQGKGLFSFADKILGGAFGDGFSENIKTAYRWLCERYEPDASIYIFGFSRGAYSARSLAGLVRKCGLVNDTSDASIDEAYGLYRDQTVSANDDHAVRFRMQFSREVTIAFVGVWDTVGELGISVDGLPLPSFSSFYRFHDTTLSNSTKAAYHAIAANEFRSLYKPTLWTQGTEDRGSLPLEQRWFAGAHANVGGGYVTPPRFLPLILAEWLRKKAEAHGLAFTQAVEIPETAYTCDPVDSYAEFTEYSSILADVCKKEARTAGGALNEIIDASLFNRLDHAGFLNAYPALREQLRTLPIGT
ncbi:Peptidoglycan binding domain protein [Candidatus Burkholderia humilis]|nr:Peptidoglycan binding domain protein [Candidatus Burkholderia humilis]